MFGLQGESHGPAQHTAARALCLCADDHGLHGAINDAIGTLVAAGRLQALGAMVGGPAWRAGTAALRAMPSDQVDIGLHLDLTEHPLRPGSRRGLRAWILATTLRLADAAALRDEIEAQLDAFEDGLGRGPAYVDGHQHVHQLPQVREALLAALARRYRGALPWIRCTRGPRAGATAKARIIEQLGARALATQAAASGFGQNAHLLGVYDFAGGVEGYAQRVRGWLHAAEAGDLLMCHPATAPVPGDPLGDARRCEFTVLAGPDIGAWLQAERIALLPMSRILATAA